jgi:hypothetical protein
VLLKSGEKGPRSCFSFPSSATIHRLGVVL